MSKPFEGLEALLTRGYVYDPTLDCYSHPLKTSLSHPKTYLIAAEHFLPKSEAERFGLLDYVIGLVDFEHSLAPPTNR